MPLDLNQLAAQAARAGGGLSEQQIADLPESLTAYLDWLGREGVLSLNMITTIRLLVAQEKIEAVQAATERQVVEAVAPEVAEESDPDAPGAVIETGPDGEPVDAVIAAAIQLDADIEERLRREGSA